MSSLLRLTLKKNRKLIYILKDVYGLGLSRARKICINLGYNYDIKVKELKQKNFNKMNSLITLKYKYLIQGELKKRIYDNINLMKIIRAYRGVRHTYKLPVNGQRTRNNAKTRRWLR
jgi:small subunit ribosomal protein S13